MGAIQQVLAALGGAGGGGGGGYTTANLVAMLAAGNASSWSGSGSWANLVASPADGEAQADYDFNPAGGGSSPTFTGSVGSPAAYWLHDGGDFFSYPGLVAAVTAFLKGLHKTGSKFTIEIWMQWGGTEASGICPVLDTGTSDQGGGDVSRGLTYVDLGNSVTNRGHSIRVMRDSSGAAALSVKADASIASGVQTMLACSIDGTGAEDSFLYKDGAYDPVSSANTWSGTFSSPGSTDPDNVPRIGARGDTVQFIPNGTRMYLLRLYNINLTKAQLDANYAAGL